MADNEILPASCTWVFPTMGIMQFNKNATDRAKEDIKSAMKTLNDHLLTRYCASYYTLFFFKRDRLEIPKILKS